MSRPILLVEDNVDDELLTLRAFRKSGLTNEILVARDGAEALHFLFGTGPARGEMLLPHVVLLDLNLPLLSGLDVLRKIRGDERTRSQPVVVLTSSKEDEDIVRSYDLGANGYVRKPVNFLEFVDVIKAIGLFWLLANESPRERKKPGSA